MYSTAYLFRFAKATVVAAIGLMALLVAMEHVLKMDITFPTAVFVTGA
jgi:hypothetical protein